MSIKKLKIQQVIYQWDNTKLVAQIVKTLDQKTKETNLYL